MGENDLLNILTYRDDIDYSSILVHIKDHSYRYIGRGSGRNVYDLNNGTVVKVAKNRRGIAQNKEEHYISDQGGKPILAKLIGISDNSRMVIMEKADKIRSIQEIYRYYNISNSKELYEIEEIRELSNQYDLVIKDFGRASNWGLIDNVPKIVDYGFTRDVRRLYYGLF